MARQTARRRNTAAEKPSSDHWLVRPENIRKLWIVSLVVLALTVLAEPLFHGHGYFGVDDLWGFNAWYGFIACVALVVFAKALGMLLKRPDTYYQD